MTYWACPCLQLRFGFLPINVRATLCATIVLTQLLQSVITQYDVYNSLMQPLSCRNTCGVKTGRSNMRSVYRYCLKVARARKFERCVIIKREKETITNHWESFRMQEAGAIERATITTTLSAQKAAAPPTTYLFLITAREWSLSNPSCNTGCLPCRSAKYSTKLPKVRSLGCRTRDKQRRLSF